MSSRSYELYLNDIRESGEAIQSYVDDIDFEQFAKDRMRCAAVIREFEIIGEAVAKLPDAMKDAFPDVPWRDIKDFRNLFIHEYFGVDIAIVWNVITEELPGLLRAVETIHGTKADKC